QPRPHLRTDPPDRPVPHFPPFSHKDRGPRGRFNLPATRFMEESMRAGERIRWRTLVAGWCVPLAAGCMAHRPVPADAPQVRAASPLATGAETSGVIGAAAVLESPVAWVVQAVGQLKEPEPGKKPEPPRAAEPPKVAPKTPAAVLQLPAGLPGADAPPVRPP